MARRAALVMAAGLMLAAAGCTSLKPWEREVQARSDMAWDPDPAGARFDAHVQFSKEASLPGGGAGGGGCGCN